MDEEFLMRFKTMRELEPYGLSFADAAKFFVEKGKPEGTTYTNDFGIVNGQIVGNMRYLKHGKNEGPFYGIWEDGNSQLRVMRNDLIQGKARYKSGKELQLIEMQNDKFHGLCQVFM